MKCQREARKSELMCLLVLVGIISMATQSGFAQNPLNFGNNFFVTGDYIVAGAYNVNQKFTTISGVSYTVGTINVPDKNPNGVANPGIKGATSVPPGGQIVAALLYWQSVEKVGAPGSGQNGFFRSLMYAGNGGPAAQGYAISGTNVSGSSPVSWSSGGCNSGSTGKILRTYRADVGAGLPVDANGNQVANGSFEVRLPSTSNNSTPLTLGATLVIIYRIPTGAGGPNIPLNAIVIYDGDYAQSNSQLTMTQTVPVFDADVNTVTRLTHIVGSGQSNKFQTVYLGKDANNLKPLPFLYGNKLPAFPGWYGTWDNVTWTLESGSSPLPTDASKATTQVVPNPMNQGCVSWGAVIVSTTVNDPQHDGILHTWKENQGYCDATINYSCGGPGDPAWVDLTGAADNQQDVFLQYDYLCSNVTGPGSCHTSTVKDGLSAVAAASAGNTTYTGTFSPTIPANTVVGIDGFTKASNNGKFTVVSCTSTQLVVNNPSGVAETNPGIAIYGAPGDQSYSFDPRQAVDYEDFGLHANAIDKVVAAYHNHGIVLHAMPGNAILEGQANVSCKDSDPTCLFPNEPGTVGYREGLDYIKNTTIEPSTGLIGCDPSSDLKPCIPVFQHGKKDSYHYALFSHGVGLPSWFLSDPTSLQSVQQTGTIVTFTTAVPHGITQIKADPKYATAKDSTCTMGRVTVVFAITNTNLNGTFCVLANPAPTATTFSIQVDGGPTNFTYTAKTDPDLSVANGQVTSISGYSDVGGQNTVVSLGYGGWGPPYDPLSDGNQWQKKAGTFMHELGHTMFLTHGGTFYNNLLNNANDFTPTFEVNCKSNVQTIMSYLFQFDLLQTGGSNSSGKPQVVVDYSEDSYAPTINENLSGAAGFLNGLTYANTASFQLPTNNSGAPHCDGSPLAPGEQSLTYVQFSPVTGFSWSDATGHDVNFNGKSTDVMHSHDEWTGTPAQPLVPLGPSPGVDLRQVSALGTVSAVGPGGEGGKVVPGGGGAKFPPGGGGGLFPPGGGGAKFPPGGGGGKYPPGGGGGRFEVTHEEANAYPRPPQGLTIVQEEASPRLIDLSWFTPTFGTVVNYNIYRSDAGGAFNKINSVSGTQTTYTDMVSCNSLGYRYEVKAVVNNDAGQPQESVASNIVPVSPPQQELTGCYANINVASPPPSAVQGSNVAITWTLTDDFYITPGTGWQNAAAGNPVTNLAANTNKISAIGPIAPNSGGACPAALPNNAPLPTLLSSAGFSANNNQFTFSWNTDTFNAGCYFFRLDLDSGQSATTASPLQLSIDVTDPDNPNVTTTSLPDANVAVSYTYTVTEDGGVGTVTWSSSGFLPPGISLDPGAGILSGTPTAGGIFTFTVTAKDTNNNTGSQTLTLRVLRTVVVPDGSQLAGTLFKITPGGTSPTATTLTGFASGQPSAVAMDANTGDMYVAIVQVNPRIVRVSSAGFVTDPWVASMPNGFTSPVAVAVDNSDNVYVGDNTAHAIYKFNPFGTQVDGTGNPTQNPFASLPTPSSPNNIRMIFDSAGDLIVASDSIASIGGSGNIEVDTISPSGASSSLYQTAPAQATRITSVGGVALASDGGIYVADQLAHAIYKIVNPGANPTVNTAIAATSDLCCSISGMSNPPSVSKTTLYLTISGSNGGTPRLVLAVPELNSVSSLFSGAPLTSPNDVAWFTPRITYYVDGNGNFGTLDPPGATVNVIGTGTVSTAGLDVTPGGQVYVYDFSNQLMQVNTSTGVTTPVGNPGNLPNPFLTTIAALTDGSFFGLDAVTGNLFSINVTTGATTQVASTATVTTANKPSGCHTHTSMAGSANVLYYTIGFGGCATPVADTLYQINPANGNTTTIGPTSVTGFIGSGFVSGKLYGFTSDGSEYVIDPATGVSTLVGNTNAPIFGAGATNFIF